MRATTILRGLLGLQQTRVLSAHTDEQGMIVDVAPTPRVPRCATCRRQARKVHDRRQRLWRHLDLCGMMLRLRYKLRRVRCRFCGVVAEWVPWAAHGVGFTEPFERLVAYLCQSANATVVSELLRIAWRSVGRIAQRVADRLLPKDLLDGLEYIGVDELSVRKHHEYITVVVDHRRRRVVWAHPGKDAKTLQRFFDQLGPERCKKLKVVTLDMSGAYIKAITEAAPQARQVFDRFHVQRLANDAVDEVRRAEVRSTPAGPEAKAIKDTRYVLLKNRWNLSLDENQRLSEIQKTNRSLYRAYLLKESLGNILDEPFVWDARPRLAQWLQWADRSRLAPFRKLGRTVAEHLDGILGYVLHGLSNGRVEGLNGKIRTLTRRAYGFHDPWSLIGLIRLCCSGIRLRPPFVHPAAFH